MQHSEASPAAFESHITHNFHPWFGSKPDQRTEPNPVWELLETKGGTEAELDAFIAGKEKEFWSVWLRDNMGNTGVVMYRPAGAACAWTDDPKKGLSWVAECNAVKVIGELSLDETRKNFIAKWTSRLLEHADANWNKVNASGVDSITKCYTELAVSQCMDAALWHAEVLRAEAEANQQPRLRFITDWADVIAKQAGIELATADQSFAFRAEVTCFVAATLNAAKQLDMKIDEGYRIPGCTSRVKMS